MGTVYLAAQPALARTVAIKLMHRSLADNSQLAALFREEAVAASRVRHPNSVTVFDCNATDGVPYIVMEHVPGRPLGCLIAEQSIPIARAIDLVLQILSVLEAVHASGVVHADIKSDNFLVDDADRLTLIDYGLARLDGATLELSGAVGERLITGTPEYMAPEAIRGEVMTPATDLYAVGAILYELLTGTTPFTGETSADVLSRQLRDVLIPPSLRCPDRSISSTLDRVVGRAMEKHPAARFVDASEFAVALRAAAPDRASVTSGDLPFEDAARADTPTRNLPTPRGRLARGSDCDVQGHGSLRHAIGDALVRGDLEHLADGYLCLAGALVEDRALALAAHELEEGIDMLDGLGGPAAPEVLDRLVETLAGIYEDLEAGPRRDRKRADPIRQTARPRRHNEVDARRG